MCRTFLGERADVVVCDLDIFGWDSSYYIAHGWPPKTLEPLEL